jgi:hypothetical protein
MIITGNDWYIIEVCGDEFRCRNKETGELYMNMYMKNGGWVIWHASGMKSLKVVYTIEEGLRYLVSD